MPVLRINQQPGDAPNCYRIEVVATEIPGSQSLSFSRDITFELTPQDGERIRWYLEDYLQYNEHPAPRIAADVEHFITECGEKLFRCIFDDSSESTRLWALAEPHLPVTRIEISTGVVEATAIPWELIRNPNTRTFLALSAESFVRTQRAAQSALTATGEARKVRILLVVCRPKGGRDVPFRSVASRLITRLNHDAGDAFELNVLRPPTYEQLATNLSLANERRRPYHIVHFDGHGTYAGDLGLGGLLVFEDPEDEQNNRYVDGFQLGALLRDAGVNVLVLNACQSAFAEAPAQPHKVQARGSREEIEAYGSLAQAVMEAGVSGVVAMRYSVYVDTAARFMAELYAALARGRRFGEAVTSARRNLHVRADRRIAYDARPLQDWSVPVVWERAPLRLWQKSADEPPIEIMRNKGGAVKPGSLDRSLPARPDFGFYGRDETLYALDRAFDTHRIVLLHAFAGSGKTATAAEFARWYAQTGGVEGSVLFSTFERYLPLARVLDKVGAAFSKSLERAGIQWDAITDLSERRDIALQIFRQVQVLWIWDNVEPINGFPAGTASDWNSDEQLELRAFLSEARDTRAKFLLTSRRDETGWLGDLARRVRMPPMPMQERLQLAGAIVSQRSKRLAELPDLTPLLRFTQGNPLTIVVTVGEALRSRIISPAQLDAFVASLHAGEVAFADEETEGRSKSLGASLSYGFDTAFDEHERRMLALLHLFQGFVDVDALRMMGSPNAEWCIDAIRGLTRERGIDLLDRAADIGLLNSHDGGYYGVHPALPWYFRTLFERCYPVDTAAADRTYRAFAEAMGQLGIFYHDEYTKGNREIWSIVAAEEDNLLFAWRLARGNRWRSAIISTMQGLRILYEHTGRRDPWARLVREVVTDFVDPQTDGPLAGLEDEWRVVTEYRADLAQGQRDWAEAERLQRLIIQFGRQRAQPFIETAPQQWNERQRNVIRSLAVGIEALGNTMLERGDPTCAELFREALGYYAGLKATIEEGVCAFNIGHAYLTIPGLRDLVEAERWYKKSLDSRTLDDMLGRAKCYGQLGLVAFDRFEESRMSTRPGEDPAQYFAEATRLINRALELTPTTAIDNLATGHHALGTAYSAAGESELALHHYRQAIRYLDEIGDIFGAGVVRRNAALALARGGQLSDARAYAEAALTNFRTFGLGAAADIESAEQLLTEIERIANSESS